MKIVINICYGGFGVTPAVYAELGIEWDGYGFLNNEDLGIVSEVYYAYRHDRRLIAAIEKIGIEKSTGERASLKIVDIPDGIEWELENHDGMESIHESHRVWD